MSKKKKLPASKKIALELFHQRLGHISTSSLLSGDTDNVWEDIELRIYPYHFCTSCQISSMDKKDRSKIPLNPKLPFKWVFMDIIPSTSSKSLTSDKTFSNYLLIVYAYYKIPKLYGIEKIKTEEVMDKLDMLKSRFVKKSVEVNYVPASAEILSKSHHPNLSIFPNLDWNISRLSTTFYIVNFSIP